MFLCDNILSNMAGQHPSGHAGVFVIKSITDRTSNVSIMFAVVLPCCNMPGSGIDLILLS